MITSLSVSDIPLSPHQASQIDLDTIQELHEQITRIKDLNPSLVSYVLHTMANTNPTVKFDERNEFRNYLQDFSTLTFLSSLFIIEKFIET